MDIWDIVLLVLMLPIAFTLTVIVHEYGHWLGGVYAGYRTVYICLFSFVFYKDASGKHRNARYHGMTGQCIMVPKNKNKAKPDDLIAGGPAASIISGIVCCVLMLLSITHTRSSLLHLGIFAGMYGAISLAFGITNLIPRGTNDGANFREIRKSDANRKAYNKVMETYAHNVWGITFREMPDTLFEVPEGAEGSLADELREYAGIKKECIEFMENGSRIADKDGETAVPDMKTGSWDLWKICRDGSSETADECLRICREHIRKKELGLGEWRTVEELITKYMEMNRAGGKGKTA